MFLFFSFTCFSNITPTSLGFGSKHQFNPQNNHALENIWFQTILMSINNGDNRALAWSLVYLCSGKTGCVMGSSCGFGAPVCRGTWTPWALRWSRPRPEPGTGPAYCPPWDKTTTKQLYDLNPVRGTALATAKNHTHTDGERQRQRHTDREREKREKERDTARERARDRNTDRVRHREKQTEIEVDSCMLYNDML